MVLKQFSFSLKKEVVTLVESVDIWTKLYLAFLWILCCICCTTIFCE